MRNRQQIKSNVTTLDKGDGTKTANEQDTTEVLADSFASVFCNEPYGPLNNSVNCNNKAKIEDIVISNKDVEYELKKLDISKSPGPDNVHPKLLKSLACNNNFVNAVAELFRKCFDTGKLPPNWKEANVTALFKTGRRADPLNYRPVSLTCILCKVYEKILRNHILNYIEQDIVEEQHGFVKGKSCTSNLLETVETILNILDEGAPVDLLYFDFRKAFDSVPHYRLLSKIEGMGISGKTLAVIRDFLSGRSMCTVVGGKRSSKRAVLSGVPQGSVLGPILFIMYINDLPDGIISALKLFADDLKLIVNVSNHEDIVHDLNYLQEWENEWLLKFNPSKCKVMHLNYNNNPKTSYFLNECLISKVDSEKDLGVVTDDMLLWNANIASVICKANQMLSWVTRNIILKDQKTMLSIYKCLIRPHLEYAVQVWNPVAGHGSWSKILELEGVQRRFTRLIDDIGTDSYSQRLNILNLTTLAERRMRGDLIETFKIVKGISSYGKNMFNISRSGQNIISRANNSNPTRIYNLRKNFITERVIKYWNKLPSFVKDSDNILNFKINLNIYKDGKHSDAEGHFWEVSEMVLSKIEGPNYLYNKGKHNEYLHRNPWVAKKKFINLYKSQKVI